MADPFGNKAKENANPIIHTIQKNIKGRDRRIKQQHDLYQMNILLLDYEKKHDHDDDDDDDTFGTFRYIDRYNLGTKNMLNLGDNDNDGESVTDHSVCSIHSTLWRVRSNLTRTAAERSVYLALKSASESNPDSTKLLRGAGFILPERNKNISRSSTSCMLQEPPFTLSHYEKRNTIAAASKKKEEKRDSFDANEVFDMIRNIQDPEHPLTLEQLNVVNVKYVQVVDIRCCNDQDDDEEEEEDVKKRTFSTVDVGFTPTIPHCSMATLIGLCIRVKLLRSLPSRFKVTVKINPGTHASEQAVNRQLDDKERVCAALENTHLLGVVNRCIGEGMKSSNGVV